MARTHVAIADPMADLSADRRRTDQAALRSGSPVDLVVIGGGVTGAGIALDAASRGLSVALLEAHDLAFGTSRWSSKLIHGGLRYLANGQVSVAWESAVERGHLMGTIATHLIRALPQVVPVMDDTPLASALLTRAGFAAGDALRALAGTSRDLLPGARILSANRTIRLLPALDRSRVRAGLLAWDGQLEDDARLVVAIARTAAAFGARILTGYRVDQASGSEVLVTDMEAGEQFEVRARHVIAAVGVWTESFDPMVQVIPSRGTHVVLRAATLGSPRAAMTVPVPGVHGRYCFVLPRPDGLLLAGITDVEQPGPIADVPPAPIEDVDWILRQVSSALAAPLESADVVGSFAGLRPLVADTQDVPGSTADVSRRHLIQRAPSGVITVTGGKLTTYRRMAEEAVDLVTHRACVTREIVLVGGGPRPGLPHLPARLVRRFGSEADRVAGLSAEHPWLLDPLAPGLAVRGVELVFAMRCEGARDLADLLERRTRLSLVPADYAAGYDRAREIVERFGPG